MHKYILKLLFYVQLYTPEPIIYGQDIRKDFYLLYGEKSFWKKNSVTLQGLVITMAALTIYVHEMKRA